MMIKTVDELITRLREEKNINVSNNDKQSLINIGYYHGYKGYRFIKNASNQIDITKFDEILSIVDFDSKIKALLYPQIMKIETVTKNRVLQLLIEEYQTVDFNEIFEKAMTDFKVKKVDKQKMKHRLKVYNNINSAISNNYNAENKIINHFYSKDRKIPLWGIFEVITLGIFADFIKSLNYDTKKNIATGMKILSSFDTDARFPERILYLIKSLRNAIAHNDVVFDVRFKDSRIDKNISKYLETETKCKNIDFNTITDYILIVAVVLKNYGTDKEEIIAFVEQFNVIIEEFRARVQTSIYNQVIYTDINQKLQNIKNFINL